jgi:hypothetical protein
MAIPKIHHVFALKLHGGWAGGEELRQRTFRVGGFYGESVLGVPSENYFFLRGYYTSQFVGQRALVGTFEYRFPIWYMDRGLGTMPFFFDVLHAAVFCDYGYAWTRTVFPIEYFRPGVGAEFRLRMLISYGGGITIRTGVARGLGRLGIWAWTLTLGTSF